MLRLILLCWLSVVALSLQAPELFPEVVVDVPGRPPSAHFSAELFFNSTWTPLYVFETTAQPSISSPHNGYFSHLENWTSSWVSSQLPSAPGSSLLLRVKRVGGDPISTAIIHPFSSGAKVLNITAEEGVVLFLDHPARVVVDMDGTMDATDTSQDYNGPPRHTFSWFVDTQLSRAELPDPTSPRTLIVRPGDAWPTGLDPAQGLTVVFAPGVHHSPASPPPPRGWVVYALAAQTRYFLCAGAVVHGTMTAGGGAWGQGGVVLGGYGVLSGESMVRADDPLNNSPQGILFQGLHNSSITGLTIVDMPNHHVVAGQSDTPGNALRNVKVMGWRTNGDGVHVFASWAVSDLFLRTQDDSLYITCGTGCNTVYERISTWNDANGVAFLFSPSGGDAESVVLRNSEAMYSRTSWFWWGPNTVFVQRGAGQGATMSGVRVENVSVEDPLPAFNPFRLELFAEGVTEGTFKDISFTNISVANFSTIRKDLKGKPLPHGIPNTIFAAPQGGGVNISNVAFLNVTFAGIPMRELITDPTYFNLSTGNLFNVTVDGVPVGGGGGGLLQ
jgi:hypothetical protein